MATLTLAICARNAQHIIGECLESIERQTVAPDAVIVAVDKLSDPTVQVARDYGATVIESNATGLYEARNAVLEACTTDLLAFTDADCRLVPDWVQRAKAVLEEKTDVAAGTGRHPPIGPRVPAAWLHHMWYVVETEQTGPCKHVIGGNSYFRTSALRSIGGWLKLPRHSAAEDLYISEALRRAGHEIWFEEAIAAQHAYETSLSSLWRKSVMMGQDIVVMLRAAGWFGSLWWYTLLIPWLPVLAIAGVVVLAFEPAYGALILLGLGLSTYLFLAIRFRSLYAAFPRWIARWVLVWPYSWGIIRGLTVRLPVLADNP